MYTQNGSRAALDRFYILSLEGLEKSAILAADAVNLTMVTPLRIIKDGRPLRELSFSALVMSLLRRMSAIAFYYCYLDLDLDNKWLSRQSQEIGIVDNGCRWEVWDKNLSGIVGSAEFSGNMAEFHRVLLFGEYFHGGKGAPYGLGRYRLRRDD